MKGPTERLISIESRNFYQGIFGELYRRFRVTSYTEIPEGGLSKCSKAQRE